MCSYTNITNIEGLFLKNKIVENKIKKNIKCCIQSTCKSITESDLRHVAAEWLIKPIGSSNNHPASYRKKSKHLAFENFCEDKNYYNIFNKLS
jgi:hypothetical protein